jgi:hypothetical protein
MARRTSTVVITRDGRDKGGIFTLTEMAAIPATEWFLRAMQLLARSGADVPPNIMQLGAAGFVTIGIGTVLTGLGKAPWHEVKPLLEELLTCVTSYQPPSGQIPLTNWNVIKGQIEEPSTVLQIHEEVVSLHLGFSLASRLLSFRQTARKMMEELGPNTQTSTEPLESSSVQDSPA